MKDNESAVSGATMVKDGEKIACTWGVSEEDIRRHRRRRIAWAVFAVLAVVGATVGIALSVTGGSSSSASNAAVHDGNDKGVTDSNGGDFIFTKQEIDTTCSETSIMRSTQECEEACVKVDCCNPYSEDTCLFDELEACFNYAKCHAIRSIDDNTNSIGPAPQDLAKVCSTVYMESDGGADCETSCEDVRCCWDKENMEDVCVADQFLICLDYAPCQNLNEATTLRVAPARLDEYCNPLNEFYDEKICSDYCDEASCCDEVGDNGSCIEDSFISCLSYAPCGFLRLPEVNIAVEAPDEGFYQDCSLKNMLEGKNRDQCIEMCQESSCCRDLSGENCFQDDPFGCLLLSACALIPFTGGDVDQAPEELWEACSIENIQEGGDAIAQCKSLCDDAVTNQGIGCCWDTNFEENCAADGNWIACVGYAPCALLDFTEGTIEPPSDAVAAECTWENLREGNTAKCQEACEGSECCFDSDMDKNCLADGNWLQCAGYAPCKLLDIVPDGQVEPATEAFKQDCTLKNIRDDDVKRDNCELACDQTSCCRSFGDDSCLTLANLMICAEYSICSVLANLPDNNDQVGDASAQDVPDAPENLDQICSYSDIKDDDAAIQVCAKECDKSSCCRDLSSPCAVFGDNAGWKTCLGWSRCAILDFLD